MLLLLQTLTGPSDAVRSLNTLHPEPLEPCSLIREAGATRYVRPAHTQDADRTYGRCQVLNTLSPVPCTLNPAGAP